MRPSDADTIVRTSQVKLIERLRHRVGGMLDRRIDRREIVDIALLQLDRTLDAGISIGPGIPESTYRHHGGRRKEGTRT